MDLNTTLTQTPQDHCGVFNGDRNADSTEGGGGTIH